MKRTRFDVDFENYLIERFGIKSQFDIIDVMKHAFLSEHLEINNPNSDVPAIGEQSIKNKIFKIRSENVAMIKFYNSDEYTQHLEAP